MAKIRNYSLSNQDMLNAALRKLQRHLRDYRPMTKAEAQQIIAQKEQDAQAYEAGAANSDAPASWELIAFQARQEAQAIRAIADSPLYAYKQTTLHLVDRVQFYAGLCK